MKIIASNFKTNHTRKSTQAFCANLESFLQAQNHTHNIILFPPATALFQNTFEHFRLGAQNAYPAKSGSFTGEIGSEQLEEFSIKSLLIGHSERRNFLKESQEFCAQKFAYFSKLDFEIFYCIGESLAVKNKGIDCTLEFLQSQFLGINLSYPKLIIAYEPIWAIGSGVSATLEEIAQIHTHLKQKLGKIPLLYGGSVNAENVGAILSLESVDGVLIGSASWSLQSFCQILSKTF